jgi:hypothetical protein
MLTTVIAAGTSLTCLPKPGGARDNTFLVTHPMTDQHYLTSTIARRSALTTGPCHRNIYYLFVSFYSLFSFIKSNWYSRCIKQRYPTYGCTQWHCFQIRRCPVSQLFALAPVQLSVASFFICRLTAHRLWFICYVTITTKYLVWVHFILLFCILCGVRDRTKEYHLSLSFMDVVKGD